MMKSDSALYDQTNFILDSGGAAQGPGGDVFYRDGLTPVQRRLPELFGAPLNPLVPGGDFSPSFIPRVTPFIDRPVLDAPTGDDSPVPDIPVDGTPTSTPTTPPPTGEEFPIDGPPVQWPPKTSAPATPVPDAPTTTTQPTNTSTPTQPTLLESLLKGFAPAQATPVIYGAQQAPAAASADYSTLAIVVIVLLAISGLGYGIYKWRKHEHASQ